MICTLVARGRSPAQGPLDRAAPPSRTAEQELLVRRQHQLPGRGFPQADEALVLKISAREHLLEGGRQLRRQRPAQPSALNRTSRCVTPSPSYSDAMLNPPTNATCSSQTSSLRWLRIPQPVQGERIELAGPRPPPRATGPRRRPATRSSPGRQSAPARGRPVAGRGPAPHEIALPGNPPRRYRFQGKPIPARPRWRRASRERSPARSRTRSSQRQQQARPASRAAYCARREICKRGESISNFLQVEASYSRATHTQSPGRSLVLPVRSFRPRRPHAGAAGSGRGNGAAGRHGARRRAAPAWTRAGIPTGGTRARPAWRRRSSGNCRQASPRAPSSGRSRRSSRTKTSPLTSTRTRSSCSCRSSSQPICAPGRST